MAIVLLAIVLLALHAFQGKAARSLLASGRSLHQLLGKAYQQMHRPTPAGLAFRRAAELRKAAAR